MGGVNSYVRKEIKDLFCFLEEIALVADIDTVDPSELEEERRLCYVGITKAIKELTMTSARQRMIRGEMQYNRVSRFVRGVPGDC